MRPTKTENLPPQALPEPNTTVQEATVAVHGVEIVLNQSDNSASSGPESTTTESQGGGRPAPPVPAQAQPAPAQVESKAAQALKLTQKHFQLVKSQDGKAYAVETLSSNPQAYRIDSNGFGSAIRRLAYSKNPGLLLTDDQLNEVRSQLSALADLSVATVAVWKRVAAIKHGIEIDVGDAANTRIAVSPGEVEIVDKGSSTLFYRSPNMLPFVLPAPKGDLRKLLRYLNLVELEQWLLIAWIAYTLAHPKVPTTNYVLLVLQGDRGTGKSSLCNIVLCLLIDPSVVGVQAFPSNLQDFAIAAENAHVLFFDNQRSLTVTQSDVLCIVCTSGYLSNRLLYSDDRESVKRLHSAVVMNGIHPFIVEPDLAQRCLTLKLQPIDPTLRTSEKQLSEQFAKDLPEIFRGILDLIAGIFTHLPSVKPIQGERMIDFVRWLSAMEKAQGFEEGYLQRGYSANLINARQDFLNADPLAEAVLAFAQQQQSWSGTPMDLLLALGAHTSPEVIVSHNWPKSPIALSLALKRLQSQLSGAGVDVEVGARSKLRKITVTYTGKSS